MEHIRTPHNPYLPEAIQLVEYIASTLERRRLAELYSFGTGPTVGPRMSLLNVPIETFREEVNTTIRSIGGITTIAATAQSDKERILLTEWLGEDEEEPQHHRWNGQRHPLHKPELLSLNLELLRLNLLKQRDGLL